MDKNKLYSRISQLKADSCGTDNGPPPEKKVAKDVWGVLLKGGLLHAVRRGRLQLQLCAAP